MQPSLCSASKTVLSCHLVYFDHLSYIPHIQIANSPRLDFKAIWHVCGFNLAQSCRIFPQINECKSSKVADLRVWYDSLVPASSTAPRKKTLLVLEPPPSRVLSNSLYNIQCSLWACHSFNLTHTTHTWAHIKYSLNIYQTHPPTLDAHSTY